jgi:hypothetical protein
MQAPIRREMTWDEKVKWVIQNVDIEWENLYVVEEISKKTTPTHIVTSQIGEEVVTTYEYHNK